METNLVCLPIAVFTQALTIDVRYVASVDVAADEMVVKSYEIDGFYIDGFYVVQAESTYEYNVTVPGIIQLSLIVHYRSGEDYWLTDSWMFHDQVDQTKFVKCLGSMITVFIEAECCTVYSCSEYSSMDLIEILSNIGALSL